MTQIIELKLKQQLSYVQIGKALTLRPETIYQAFKRF